MEIKRFLIVFSIALTMSACDFSNSSSTKEFNDSKLLSQDFYYDEDNIPEEFQGIYGDWIPSSYSFGDLPGTTESLPPSDGTLLRIEKNGIFKSFVDYEIIMYGPFNIILKDSGIESYPYIPLSLFSLDESYPCNDQKTIDDIDVCLQSGEIYAPYILYRISFSDDGNSICFIDDSLSATMCYSRAE